MPNLYIARQPIYDSELNVIAYGLLYHNDDQHHAEFSGAPKTTYMAVNALLEIGLGNLLGRDHRAFISVAPPFLLDIYPMPFPKQQVVLELPENIVIDDGVLAACRRLAIAGHTIALDNFVYRDALKPLLEIIHIAKIDVLLLGMEETRRQVEALKPFKIKLLAEKIENHEVLEQCKALGFEYFQGYFLARPNLIKPQRAPGIRLTALRTLSILQDPQAEIKDIEAIISQDVALSYKLLRYINSVSTSLTIKVDSIHQALIIAGTECIRLWSTLIVLSDISEKPHEIMTIALVRAKMCELLADKVQLNKGFLFTIGLFSTLDALMDQPLQKILAHLPLSETTNDALLNYKGKAGEVLRAVLAYEEGVEMEEIKQLGLPLGTLSEAYLQAIQWADNNIRSLAPHPA